MSNELELKIYDNELIVRWLPAHTKVIAVKGVTSNNFRKEKKEIHLNKYGLFVYIAANMYQFLMWSSTEVQTVAIGYIKPNRSAHVEITTEGRKYFSKQKLRMFNSVKTELQLAQVGAAITSRRGKALMDITMHIGAYGKHLNVWYTAEILDTNKLLRIYRRISDVDKRMKKFMAVEPMTTTFKVSFRKLNHTQLSKYGISKAEFDLHSAALPSVTSILRK
jgi:hypothetical protein